MLQKETPDKYFIGEKTFFLREQFFTLGVEKERNFISSVNEHIFYFLVSHYICIINESG